MNLDYKITSENEFYNVKDVLKSKFKISSRLILMLKKTNSVMLNNKTCSLDDKVKSNDFITISLDFEEDNSNIVPAKMDLDIIYEDDCFLIVNKGPNMPVHPSMLHYTDSLSNGIKYYFDTIGLKKKIRPVNRLDKDTSGLVIFAKNQYIQDILIKQMQDNTFQKEYIGILDGTLENKEGTINAPISRKENSIIERQVSLDGQKATTHYKVLKENNILSLVNFKLETGRCHQIRVHSAHIGHPILGDTLYGKKSELIERQALHSYKICFTHPVTNKTVEFISNPPKDMEIL